MNSIVMPEIVLYKTLTSIVEMIRADFDKNHDKDTILYSLFGEDENGNPLTLNSYNFFNQSKKIFKDLGNLKVNMGYNPEVAKNLALHIILPSEQGKSGIGYDEGYNKDKGDADEVLQDYYTSSFDANYQIMITGNNSNEVNLVYTALKSILLMVYEHLEVSGLRLPVFSGNDIIMQEDLTPVMLFHKVINVSFFYELNVPKLYKNGIMKSFSAMYRAIDK